MFLVKPAVSRGTYSLVKLHNSNPSAGITRIRCISAQQDLTLLADNGYVLSLSLCFLQNKAPLLISANV